MIQACQSCCSVSWAINSWQTSNKISCDHFPHFREEKNSEWKPPPNTYSCSFNWGKVFTCDRHRWRLKVSCPAFLPRHRKVFDEYVRLEPVLRKNAMGFRNGFLGKYVPSHPPFFAICANVQMHLGNPLWNLGRLQEMKFKLQENYFFLLFLTSKSINQPKFEYFSRSLLTSNHLNW